MLLILDNRSVTYTLNLYFLICTFYILNYLSQKPFHRKRCRDSSFIVSAAKYCLLWRSHCLLHQFSVKGLFFSVCYYDKQCCNKKSLVPMPFHTFFVCSQLCQSIFGIEVKLLSYRINEFSLLRDRYCQVSFVRLCTSLHLHQKCVKVPASSQSCQQNILANIQTFLIRQVNNVTSYIFLIFFFRK